MAILMSASLPRNALRSQIAKVVDYRGKPVSDHFRLTNHPSRIVASARGGSYTQDGVSLAGLSPINHLNNLRVGLCPCLRAFVD